MHTILDKIQYTLISEVEIQTDEKKINFGKQLLDVGALVSYL